MNEQIVLNILFAVAAFALAWVMNGIKDSLKALHDADTSLTTKVQAIELLVAGAYVKKDELTKALDPLLHKLEKIDIKLDSKLDRVNGNVYYDRSGDKP